MRSAIILPWKLSLDMGDWDPRCTIEPGYVSLMRGPRFCPKMEQLRSDLGRFASCDSGVHWNCCEAIGPHTDDVLGDYTVGVVHSGGGILFTNNGRNVGRLRPGNVFFLNNKKLHGLKKDPEQPPMVFATIDFVSCRFWEMARFLMNRDKP